MIKCCCCFKARTGAYIIGILGIIFGISCLAILLVDIFATENHSNGVEYVFYISIGGSIFYTVFQLFLLFGLIKNKPCLIKPWLVVQAFFGALSCMPNNTQQIF